MILVDEDDNEIGTEEKMKAHENGGKLHRAFSIFIFDAEGKMMLQQRAVSKYHCGGLWTNTCCSHPRPGESLEDATHRRLEEEMGFDCDIKEIVNFTYKAPFENGLTEWEFDHVFAGVYDGPVVPNPEEVESFKSVGVESLEKDLDEHPERYTPWFKIIVSKVIDHMRENKGLVSGL